MIRIVFFLVGLSLLPGVAHAGQACMQVTGSFVNSCKNILVSGNQQSTCSSLSPTTWWYGFTVSAVCKDNTGNWVQHAALPISTNTPSGGGNIPMQTQTCHGVGNNNGYLFCEKR
jgi:hypothetical protein